MLEIQNADRDGLSRKRDVDRWVTDGSEGDVDGCFLTRREILPLAHRSRHLGEDILPWVSE